MLLVVTSLMQAIMHNVCMVWVRAKKANENEAACEVMNFSAGSHCPLVDGDSYMQQVYVNEAGGKLRKGLNPSCLLQYGTQYVNLNL